MYLCSMNSFIAKFKEQYRLSDVDTQTLLNNMEEVHFKKREMIVREGTKNTNLYLIREGVWRGHYLKDGVDATVWFATKSDIAFSVWGYVDNSYSQISIEAMSDSTAYCISGEVIQRLYDSSHGLANLGRRLMEQQLLNIENWLISSGCPRAKERYLTLIEDTPELLKYVPLKHIASFLWITPQSLSRIRTKITQQSKGER